MIVLKEKNISSFTIFSKEILCFHPILVEILDLQYIFEFKLVS